MITRIPNPETLAHVLDALSRRYLRASAPDDMGDFLSMMPTLTRMTRSADFIDLHAQHKSQCDSVMRGPIEDAVPVLAKERGRFLCALSSIVPRELFPLYLCIGHVEYPVAGGKDVFEFQPARDAKPCLFDFQLERLAKEGG